MKRLLLTLPLFLLCGCWDYSEASMQEYVLGVGIDRTEIGYAVTIETADLSGSPESPSSAKLITCEGEDLFDAIRNAIPHAGKKLYWGHCALAVIDGAIKDEQLYEVLDVLLRAQDVYQSVAILITRDASANAVFSAECNGSGSVTEHCLHIFENQASSRRFQKCELWEYARNKELVMLPTVSLEYGIPQITGGAIYRNETRLATLSGDEVLLLSVLTEEVRGGWLPKIRVSPTTSVSTEILAGSVLTKDQTLSLTLTLAVSSSDTAFNVADRSVRSVAERAIEKTLEEKVNLLLTHASRAGFASLIHPTARNVEVTVRLRNSGMRASEGNL